MRVPRLQLFELEDQSWFPSAVRDLATDYLRFVERRFRFHLHALPVLARVIDESGVDQVVDLCSGGGGPVPELLAALRQQGVNVRFTLTDLYPNLTAFEELSRRSGGQIDYRESPVDARNVPPDLEGLRTFFNAFHHFGPEDAVAILQDAADSGHPIAAFEIPQRSVPTILPLVLTPILVWVATPFIRPFSWRRVLLTYVIPAVPLTCLWDGIVSQLRAYHPDELLALANRAERAHFHWEAGTHRAADVPGRLTYLIGRPDDDPEPRSATEQVFPGG